jgi:hypothetical protein
MKEKFEHKITNRIIEIFDSKQVDYSPQDWENMKTLLPERRIRKYPYLWTSVKAASVLLLITAGSYFIWESFVNDQNTVKENSSNSVNVTGEKAEIADKTVMRESIQPVPADTSKTNTGILNISESRFQESKEKIAERNLVIPPQTGSDLQEIIMTDTFFLPNPEEKALTIALAEVQNVPQSVKDTAGSPADNIANQDDATFEILGGEVTPKRQKIKLGVEVASFTNYSNENLAPAMNYGGGLVANIPIKSRFSFNPGLIVLAYNMNLNAGQEQYDENIFTTTSVQEIIENDPDIKPAEVNLTGIDIPVNFQYRFIKRKKSDYFVELGFSNLVYLSENYSYSFTKLSGPNPYTGTLSEETVTGSISNPAFETFDFAKIINFSIGWNYKLNSRFDFSLNPYIKYPLGTLGSEDVRFGSGGMKLKLMVKPGKK